MASDQLASQLRKLNAAPGRSQGHATLRRTAVQGIFHTLAAERSKLGTDALSDEALSACLEHAHEDVVLLASELLVAMVLAKGAFAKEASNSILNALPTAGQASACALADALVRIQFQIIRQPGYQPPPSGLSPHQTPWSSHPLASALLLNPGCADRLASSTVSLLSTAAAAGAAGGTIELIWQYLCPFFTFVLLQGTWSEPTVSTDSTAPTATWAMIPSLLEGLLVRLACNFDSLLPRVLQLLTDVLPCCSLAKEADRIRVLSWIPDIIDVTDVYLEYCTANGTFDGTADSSKVVLQLRDSVVRVCWEVQPLCGTIAVPLAALVRLQQMMPECMGQLAPTLSMLSLGATEKDGEQLHLLLYRALEHADVGGGDWERAMIGQPLASSIAYGSAPKAKKWAAHLLQLLSNTTPAFSSIGQGVSAPVGASWHGDLCQLDQCRCLLHHLWSHPNPDLDLGAQGGDTGPAGASRGPPGEGQGSARAAIRWLNSLHHHLLSCKGQMVEGEGRGGDASTGAGSGSRRSATSALLTALEPSNEVLPGHQSQVEPELEPSAPACMVLAALLAHPQPGVCVLASAVLKDLLLLSPLSSLSFLPLVMALLRRLGTQAKPPNPDSASIQLSLLNLLPAMTGDASVAPFAIRVLQQLLQPSSPLLLHCLGLHLVVEAWKLTGRGWPRVEAALIGYSPPTEHQPQLQLRLTRANLIRVVCEKEPFKGVELVVAIQDCLQDENTQVAATGMIALTALCREDAVDFYKAIPIVHRFHPHPPKDPFLAAAWVSLLSTGALDAEAHPERATATVEALWAATRHSSSKVRKAAFEGLEGYSLDVLEKMEFFHDEDLINYVKPLLSFPPPSLPPSPPTSTTSTTSTNRHAELAAVENLAQMAVQHEHDNRRRYMVMAKAAVGPKAGAGGAEGKGGVASDREIASLKHRLTHKLPKLLLGPATDKAPKPSHSSTGACLLCVGGAGSELYKVYLAEALQRVCHSPWTHPGLVFRSWTMFFSKWMDSPGCDPSTVHSAFEACRSNPASPAMDENASLASVALLSVLMERTGGGLMALEDVTKQLRAVLDVDGSSSAVQRSALTALALSARHLHPTDKDGQAAVHSVLQQYILSPGRSPPCRSAAAAAIGMFMLAGSPVLSSDLGGPGGSALLTASLSLLLSCIASCAPQLVAAVHSMAEGAAAALQLPKTLELVGVEPSNVGGESAESAEVDMLPGALLGVALLAGILPSHSLTTQLYSLVVDALASSSSRLSPSSARELAALIDVLPITCLSLYQHGVLPGTAGASLDKCASLLLPLIQKRRLPGRLRGSAARALGALLSSPWGLPLLTKENAELDAICDLAKSGGWGLQGSDAQCGALAGLAALLQGPNAASANCGFYQRMCQAQANVGASYGGGLLEHPMHTNLSKRVLHCLEGLAPAPSSKSPKDGRVQTAAAWLLAEVCASTLEASDKLALAATEGDASLSASSGIKAGGGESGDKGAQGGLALRPLSAYPETGALRPLVTLVTDPVLTASLDRAVLGAAVRCLAQCPRLPSMDWGAVCRRLWQLSFSESGTDPTLQVTIIQLALAHGSHTSLYLGPWLNEQLTAGAMRRLDPVVQAFLMSHLPAAMTCLAGSAASTVILGLPEVTAASGGKGGPVSAALWRGLAGVCTAMTGSAGKRLTVSIGQAVSSAVQMLYKDLPLLPPMLPGEVAMLVDSAVHLSHSNDNVDCTAAPTGCTEWSALVQEDLELWGAAVHCLICAGTAVASEVTGLMDLQTSSTVPEDSYARLLRNCQMRCLLVLATKGSAMAYKDLAPCRSFCVSASPSCMRALLPLLSQALAVSSPQVAQSHMLQEAFDVVHVSSNRLQALQLAATLAATWSLLGAAPNSAAEAAAAVVASHVTLLTPEVALAGLPFTLPKLLKKPAWRSYREVGLKSLVTSLHDLQDGQHKLDMTKAPLLSCLLALKEPPPNQKGARVESMTKDKAALSEMMQVLMQALRTAV